MPRIEYLNRAYLETCRDPSVEIGLIAVLATEDVAGPVVAAVADRVAVGLLRIPAERLGPTPARSQAGY
jgi:hypothetical protein